MTGSPQAPITPETVRAILDSAGCTLSLNDASVKALAASLTRGRKHVEHLRALGRRERTEISAARKKRWRQRESAAGRARALPPEVWGAQRSRRTVEARREGIAALVGTLASLFPAAILDDAVTPPTLTATPNPSPLIRALVLAWPLVLGVNVSAEAVLKALTDTGLAGRLLRPPTEPRRFSSKD
jgi:hypothetical protein